MDRNDDAANFAGESQPSEAWLFAQALLGNPIPDPRAAAERARAERERLEWLAQISTEHEGQLRQHACDDGEARRQRQQLEWLAAISDEHERTLLALLRAEALARQSQQPCDGYAGLSALQEQGWDPSKHPRRGGAPNAGWFASAGGAGGSGGGQDHRGTARDSNGADHQVATPDMLEMAHAWWQTQRALEQTRRDLEELPKRIANEQAQLGSGGRYAYIHAQNLAKAQRDLAAAKALAPQLEKQLGDLEQQYHDSGYDDVPYATFTPGETIVGGRGIERVGHAVAVGGSPAGLQPTGIEFDVALGAASVFQLGRSALRKAASAQANRVAGQPAALRPYGGPGGGHHIPAKKAFEGAAGYNAKAALAIPIDELERLNVMHSAITGAQKTLYRQFAKTGTKLTWAEVERIETEALVRAGVDSSVARATVKRAIDSLKDSGVANPTRIPWGNNK